jgi:hypothetical protein
MEGTRRRDTTPPTRMLYCLESIPAEVTGTVRPIEVYRAERKGSFVKPWEPKADDDSYCPARWTRRSPDG